MKFILATKSHMTQVFDEKGVVHPVTVLQASKNVVTQVKTADTDGYVAVQVGFGERKKSRATKAELGHLKDLGMFQVLREFRSKDGVAAQSVGDGVEVSSFEPGEYVHVSATSKGKGFQGVVKRHGFAGGRRSHGQKHSEREPGSIGATGPQRVPKGRRMGGRMGGDRVTVRNLKVIQVNPEEGLLLVEGAVPGRRGTLVEVRAA